MSTPKPKTSKGTAYVSTPKLIADVEKPKAINLSTGKELETDGEYWGDLRFRVEDALPVKVWHERYPGGNIELMTPDEDGCYTIPADYDVTLHHDICIEDACGNKTYYNDIDILWNYLEVVREKDYWDVQPAQPIRISREQDLQEELSKVNIGVFASDVTGFIPVDVSWEIPEDYDPQSPREQTFTVLGTVILEGTGARCVSGLDVITRPGEEWKKNFAISVTVEGAPRYKVTTEDSANGSVTVVNATETTEDGTPLFYKDELVMLSIAPRRGLYAKQRCPLTVSPPPLRLETIPIPSPSRREMLPSPQHLKSATIIPSLLMRAAAPSLRICPRRSPPQCPPRRYCTAASIICRSASLLRPKESSSRRGKSVIRNML